MSVRNSRKSQSGAVLFVALVLLVVITVIAVSAMGISRLELLIAGNTQYGMQAFQRGQSALEARFAQGDFTTTMSGVSSDYKKDDEVIATTKVSYIATSNAPPGYSLDAGYSAFHFEMKVNATAPRSAQSDQTLGFYIVGPGGN